MDHGSPDPCCGDCGLLHHEGHPYSGGWICDPCWQRQTETITSRLADRVRAVFPQAGAMTASRAIASAFPSTDARVQAWYDLGAVISSRRNTPP